jgi:UDP-4-amino-4,6-dideoxy-N-acetyl-beta-L-altrosamine N-acetyltransferase
MSLDQCPTCNGSGQQNAKRCPACFGAGVKIGDVNFHHVGEEDLAQLLEWRNSHEVARWMYTDHVITPAEHRAWYERIKDSGDYWIFDYQKKPIGLLAFHDVVPGSGATWAFYIGDTSIRGKGLGKLMAYNAMQFAFEYGDGKMFPKLCYEVLATNDRVVGMFERMGYVVISREDGRAVKEGKPVTALTLYMHEYQWRHGKRTEMEDGVSKDGHEPVGKLSEAYALHAKKTGRDPFAA